MQALQTKVLTLLKRSQQSCLWVLRGTDAHRRGASVREKQMLKLPVSPKLVSLPPVPRHGTNTSQGITYCTFLFSTRLNLPISGHGRLLDPPARGTMWRVGFDTPHNYDDNQMNCGGFAVSSESVRPAVSGQGSVQGCIHARVGWNRSRSSGRSGKPWAGPGACGAVVGLWVGPGVLEGVRLGADLGVGPSLGGSRKMQGLNCTCEWRVSRSLRWFGAHCTNPSHTMHFLRISEPMEPQWRALRPVWRPLPGPAEARGRGAVRHRNHRRQLHFRFHH